jgi:2-alkenal reductase
MWIITALIAASFLGGFVGGWLVSTRNTTPRDDVQAAGASQEIPLGFTVDISTAVTEAVSSVGPAVVTVVNNLPPQRTLFGSTVEPSASGSGVIISQDGYIVTNNHVVEGAASLEVILANGDSYPATLIGVDEFADLAVVRTEAPLPAVAPWGNSDTLKPGESVIAIGSPLGDFKNTVTTGVVSATERSIDVDQNYQLEGLIQTDAAINQGNSGGPLVNLGGQVVGINTLVVRGNAGAVAEGLGFAIPSNTARAIAGQLIEKGYVARPYMGIRWGWITPPLAARYRLPVDYGVYMSDIVPGGPADHAGLRQGDILLAVNGERIDDEHPFMNIIFEYAPHDTVVFTILREGAEKDLQITFGEKPSL